ncbi:MBG domain-containing protein [Tunicatimonas pelagia]|uniref:MBG domain-containing protein n=1 Tax=Tunicatimonas pelagia TaxID=931531 RepID=UPI00266565EF|nr:MBG domain-containing protein [Tunicatimonas pelagia]WKN42447.1 MBG domain-containing protein [Tunicatimonas pelagia]
MLILRRYYILLLFTFLSIYSSQLANAQTTLNWAQHYNGSSGGIGKNGTNSVEVDRKGNVAICGYFKNQITINGQSYEATDFGSFIVKFDPVGQLLWSKTLDAQLVTYASRLFYDSQDNLYFTGQLKSGSIDFSEGASAESHSTLSGTNIFFISKFNQDGAFQWVKVVPGVATLSHDYFYINEGGSLYKLDLNAELIWERPGIQNYRKISISASPKGIIWIAGDFYKDSELTIGSTVHLSASAATDLFLVKFSADGTYEKAKSIVGNSSDQFNDMIVQDNGNVVITGGFKGRLHLDDDHPEGIITSKGSYDIFVAAYNANLALNWGHSIGKNGWDDGRALTRDRHGQIYLTGAFQYTVDFDPSSNQANLSTPPVCVSNVYLLKLNENGNYLGALRFGNSRIGYGNKLAVFSDHLFLGGDFERVINFNPVGGQSTTLTASGRDQFLLQLKGFSPITKWPQAITMDEFPDVSYATESFTLSATTNADLPLSYSSTNPTVATIVGDTVMVHSAGVTKITVSQEGSSTYEAATPVSQSLEVDKVPLTVTTADYHKIAGEPNPQFVISYSGWVRGDSSSQIDALPQASAVADQNSLPGEYDIVLGEGADRNYAFDYIPGKLIIQKELQSITFEAIPKVSYGDASVLLSAQSSAGLPLSYVSSNPEIARVENGEVVILGAGSTTIEASQQGNDWYKPAASVSQDLTVSKAVLSVTAKDVKREQGLPNPEFLLTYTGWIGDDSIEELSEQPIAFTDANRLDPIGSYPIQIGGGSDENYAFQYNEGTLLIEPHIITGLPSFSVTLSKVYPNPTTGLLNVIPINTHHGLIRLYNPLGACVIHDELKATTVLDLSEYATGVYLLEVISGDYRQAIRIAKD